MTAVRTFSIFSIVVAFASGLIACKEADFAGTSQRRTTSGVERNGGPLDGDALGKPGSPVQNPGSTDDSGENDANKPTKPGIDPTPDPSASPTPVTGTGKPPITEENGPGSGQKPPITEENGPVTGPQSEISIVGLRADSNDAGVTLHIKKRDGSWGQVQWPRKGQTVKLEGVCNSKKDVEIEIKTELRGNVYFPTSTSCFVGKTESDKSLVMGFEHDCNSTNYNKIDDTIARFSCPDKGLKIQSLRLDPGISMGEWLD